MLGGMGRFRKDRSTRHLCRPSHSIGRNSGHPLAKTWALLTVARQLVICTRFPVAFRQNLTRMIEVQDKDSLPSLGQFVNRDGWIEPGFKEFEELCTYPLFTGAVTPLQPLSLKYSQRLLTTA